MSNSRHFIVILNIPPAFHVSDLRSFFSSAIESEKFFECFHFRHRPQKEFIEELEINFPPQSNICAAKNNIFPKALVSNATCATLEFPERNAKVLFMKRYHFENWIDGAGNVMLARCIFADVKVVNENIVLPLSKVEMASGRPIQLKMELIKVQKMIEFMPPVIMPKGNVGTPTRHFKQLIQKCQLPTKLITKLGLTFFKQRSRKYGCVPYEYEHSRTNALDADLNYLAPNQQQRRAAPQKLQTDDSSGEEEEWDRHENLHDDIDQQSRSKERLYEEEMEVVWEKGGPGLVWYTDAQYWHQQEGDFDEETSDDWDVDFSVYFEENGGDKDACDALEMRRSDQWRLCGSESVFKRRQTPIVKDYFRRKLCNAKIPRLGSFEIHTRGIGRRLLEKQGWKDGMGLGRTTGGIAEALEPDGQKPRERKGLGYYGEALVTGRNCGYTSKTAVRISTVYDDQTKSDPPEVLLTRQPSTHMKYRQGL